MTNEPFVSVIVPVHNRPRELKRSVESVMAQSYTNYEVIIVDDCSTDDTPQVIEQLQEQDARIKGFRNEKNGGGAYARNQGVARSHGNLIAFLDSDDEWLPEKLEHQVRFMEGCNKETVLSTFFLLKKGRKFIKRNNQRIRTGRIREDLLKGKCNSLTSGMLIRKEHFKRVGGYSDELRSMQDYDLWIKLSEFYELQCVPEYLVIVHTDSDVRISINPAHRIAGIESFLSKWSAVIEKEVGVEYVNKLRASHLGTVYFGILVAAFKEGNFEQYFGYETRLKRLGYVSRKRRLFMKTAHAVLIVKKFFLRRFGYCSSS